MTDATLNSKQEADEENEKLIKEGSLYRWVTSYIELGRLEEKHSEAKQNPVVDPIGELASGLQRGLPPRQANELK